jgi:general secretion pathway protein D
MIPYNKLRALAPLCVALMLLPVGDLEASNRKGDKLYKLGEQAEARKDYDKALQYYQQALDLDPKETTYELAARRTRAEAGEAHVDAGKKLLKADDLEKALAEFQKAFAADPGSMIALQEMQQTKELLDQKQKGLVPPGEKPLTSAEKAQKDSLEMIQSLQSVPELKPVTNQISLLKMNNQPLKVLYETVGKLAGINVLFDPTMQAGKNANLDLNNVTLQEALDYIALLTKTYWKPVSANAIFVTEDNVTKRRDYEDEVVKVFYLKNPTSTQEFNEMVTAVRSVTDVRRMFQFNAENAVVVRDTVDKVALVEKLLHNLDKPKAEVVVDVIVMDVSSDISHQIGAGLVSNGTNGLNIPIQFSPTNPITSSTTGASGTGGTGATSTTTTTTTTGTTTPTSTFVALSQLGHIGTSDFSTSLPGATLQAVMNDSRTKIQESPEVRVSDGQKVSLKIGEKYPYATGSFQPGVGTVGVSPLVSTQFQFVDVGVNVELTPHVHGDDEVTLHVSIDISDIATTLNLGGLSQPVIGQKKNEADIRLKDGEVSLLGGLMSDQDTSTVSGIPGLVNIPILGKYLFGNVSKDRQKEQLMIALIPHIVRRPDITGLDLKGISAGSDSTVKLSYAPRVDQPAAPAAPAVPTPAAPGATAPAVTPATPGGAPGLTFNPARVQAPLSSQVKIAIEAQNMADLASVPVKVRWDPKILRLEMISPGALLTQDGKIVAPSLDIRNDTGDASIEVNRVAGAAGVSGTGALLQLTFTAVGKGTTTVSVTEASLKNSAKQTITVQAPSVSVVVQ